MATHVRRDISPRTFAGCTHKVSIHKLCFDLVSLKGSQEIHFTLPLPHRICEAISFPSEWLVLHKHAGICFACTATQGCHSLLQEIISTECNLKDILSSKYPCGCVGKRTEREFRPSRSQLRGYKLLIIWWPKQHPEAGVQALLQNMGTVQCLAGEFITVMSVKPPQAQTTC